MTEPLKALRLSDLVADKTPNKRVSTLIRSRLDEITTAQNNGASNATIAEALGAEFDIKIEVNTFTHTLWRIRNVPGKRNRSRKPATTAYTPQQDPETKQEVSESTDTDAKDRPTLKILFIGVS